MSTDYKNLRQFATPRQNEYIDAIEEFGSQRKAAEALDINSRVIERSLANLRNKATTRGYDPDHDMVMTCPEGYFIKGTSTYYTNDENGTRLAGQWVKTQIDTEQQRKMFEEAIQTCCEDIPRLNPAPAPRHTESDLLNLYTITDYHLGMLAWHEETGDDWDLKIAEDLLVRWMQYAIENSPEAEVGYLAQLGDFLHWDGIEAVTPTSGHLLDADTRFQKLVRSAIRVLRQCVDIMLRKHKHVVVLMAEGNHDIASSIWLREMFAAMYENDPRIEVEKSPDPYYCYEHGKTSLFFHHGHKRKTSNIHGVFAAKFREVFGRTKYSYGHMGHLHHTDVKENELMVVEQHNTLAGADAYASRGGWLSHRKANVITYHKEHGEVWRHSVTPNMVR